MKLQKQKIIQFDHLMHYYKYIFPIFHWVWHPSAFADRKMAKLSSFLKKHIFLYSLFNLTFISCILPLSHCKETNLHVAHVNIETILVVNSFSIIIVIAPLFLNYDNFNRLWYDITDVNKLILKRLNHRINYREFLRSFIISSACVPAIFLIYGIFKVFYKTGSTSTQYRLPIVLMKIVYLYVEIHAIFVIMLFLYIYQMFGKYVNFAYHVNRSNLIFLHVNNLFDNLKFYKEIHYKLWLTSRELDKFFGLSVAAFCGQTFFDASYSVYFIFHFWDLNGSQWLSKNISKCLNVFSCCYAQCIL